MVEGSTTTGAAASTAPGGDPGPGWSEAMEELAGAGAELGQLLLLELRLTLLSLRRMLLLAILFLPLLLLIWLALSALPALMLYQYSGSPVLAVVLFLAVQVLAFGLLVQLWKHYRAGLGLPRTRHQMENLLRGTGSEPPAAH